MPAFMKRPPCADHPPQLGSTDLDNQHSRCFPSAVTGSLRVRTLPGRGQTQTRPHCRPRCFLLTRLPPKECPLFSRRSGLKPRVGRTCPRQGSLCPSFTAGFSSWVQTAALPFLALPHWTSYSRALCASAIQCSVRAAVTISVTELVGTSRKASWDLGSPIPPSHPSEFLSTVWPREPLPTAPPSLSPGCHDLS